MVLLAACIWAVAGLTLGPLRKDGDLRLLTPWSRRRRLGARGRTGLRTRRRSNWGPRLLGLTEGGGGGG